ncbi:type II toxin-antitoxin system RelE/ParE family toxin [Brevundimonas staleyi]|uniref:Type II toxin-antitoxin system RelE/ParE family toxin n=1 Tax=Brevundimonas staleyi TaxID=74326 RepID=A0ABW0FS54_9CAUL
MTDLRWSDAAAAELTAAYDYIAQDDPRAALKVFNRIVAAAELVARRNIGRVGRRLGTFEKSVIGAPYVLIYVRDEEQSETTITSVIHTARQWPPVLGADDVDLQ